MSSSKVIITGATGNAGSAIVSAAIASSAISEITVLSRRPPYETHPKLRYIQLPSAEYPTGFDEFPERLVQELKGNDAIIWALGISQNDVSKEDYIKITHDYTLTAAKALSTLGTPSKPFRFIYMSGEGADQSEKSWTLFGRIKGRTEKALFGLRSDTFEPLSIRPGGINPAPNTQAKVKWFFPILAPLISTVYPKGMIESTNLAKVCVGLAADANKKGWDRQDAQNVINNVELRKLTEVFKDI